MSLLPPEPASTHRLRALVQHARARLQPRQAEVLRRWELDAIVAPGLAGPALEAIGSGYTRAGALRGTVDAEGLGRVAALAARRRRHRGAEQPAPLPLEALEAVAHVLKHAPERPAVVSAQVWRHVGDAEPALGSHLVQLVRERAQLPPLRRQVERGEPGSSDHLHVEWFGDRQLADAAAWCEHVPAAPAATLVETLAVAEAHRAAAMRLAPATLVPFVRRAAAALLALARRHADPLGLPLAPEASLDLEPSASRRVELAHWALRAGHAISVRGHILVLSIAIGAPWPWTLELVAAELGTGFVGGLGMLLRIAGAAVPAQPAASPILLCLPDEPIEELGARWERWLGLAYPHAIEPWWPWI